MAGRKPGTPKTGGRRKGTPNKVTSLAKDAIAAAAEELGGAERLVAWAREDPANERVFWGTIYPKLLPLQAGGSALRWPGLLSKTNVRGFGRHNNQT